MRILVLGPQGSGKGTQAEMISKKYGIPHVDVGRLLREHVAKKTGLGKKIAGMMRRGELLPHEVVNEVIQKRLLEPDCKNGFVIDGYPRQLEEAEFLDSITSIDRVIILDVPDEVAVERLSKRRVCKGCPTPLYGLPEKIREQCKACGGELVQREDDKPEAVRKRLKIYHEVSEPLIEYYKPRSIVRVVDGTKSIDETFSKITSVLGE